MTTDYNRKFLVYSTEIGAEGVLATYDTYREAELYIIHHTKSGTWSSMAVEEHSFPQIPETPENKYLRLRMGWHCTAHYEKEELKISYPQKVWAVVEENCEILPIEKLDKKSIRCTSFVSTSHCVEMLRNNAESLLRSNND